MSIIIPEKIQSRMSYLEKLHMDIRDGKSKSPALLQISKDAGKFLSMISSLAPEGEIVEVGTSGGYSTLWLSLTAIERSKKIITFEILDEKFEIAKETFEKAEVTDYVNSVKGDATKLLKKVDEIGLCFLDANKEVYEQCYDIILPKLVPGGIIVADNVLSHKEIMKSFVDRVSNDDRVGSITIPIGTGMLLIKKT